MVTLLRRTGRSAIAAARRFFAAPSRSSADEPPVADGSGAAKRDHQPIAMGDMGCYDVVK
jgi:hypothetical protein